MMMTALIGALTGFVSAMLFASASTGTVLGVLVLFFLSPMPVAIAGIGWNSRAALVAVCVATLLIFLIGRGGLVSPLFYVLALGAPAVVLSHLLLLARPVAPDPAHVAAGPEPQAALEWYPVGRAIALAAVWAGVLGSIAMLNMDANLDTVMPELKRGVARMVALGYPIPGAQRSADGSFLATPEQIEAMARLMLALMPGMIAAFWLLITMINLWLASATAFAAGRLKRPWPDLATLVLPSWLPALLAASLAGCFAGGATGRIATAFALGCLAATTLAGLAILHYVTRGHQLRPLVLMAAYGTLATITPISAIGISLLALVEPIVGWNRRGPPPASPPPDPMPWDPPKPPGA